MPGERAGLEDDPQLREARWLGEAITAPASWNLPVLLTGFRRTSSFSSVFFVAYADEGEMLQVPSIGPFAEGDLADQLRFDPGAFFHFSAVSTSPHREVLFSGRLVNGQCVAPAFLSTGKISFRIRGIWQEGSVLYFTYFRESACSVSMVVTAKRSAIDGALVQECIF
jgi:hypothetical protein